MNTLSFEKGIPMSPRACLLVGLLFTGLSLAGAGCVGGFNTENLAEGERCNPLDIHNECGSGLVCTGQGSAPSIPSCPENYCCSVDTNGNINSTNPSCQPGCSGGAASICAANMDPAACLLANGPSEAGAPADAAGE